MKNAELEGAAKNIWSFLMKYFFWVEIGKVSSMEKDMGFQIQLLQTELEEERKRNKVDLSALDRELKSDYEARSASSPPLSHFISVLFPSQTAG